MGNSIDLTAKDFLTRLKSKSDELGLVWTKKSEIFYKTKFDFVQISTRAKNFPILLIRAGVHGDEISGPMTLLDQLDVLVGLAEDRGLGLIIYPLANPEGFENGTHGSSSPKKGDDFVRYEDQDDFKGKSDSEEDEDVDWKFTWDADPSCEVSQETAVMMKEFHKLPWDQIVAFVDLHQDYGEPGTPVRPPETYCYVYGDREDYRHLAKAASEIVPFYKDKPSNTVERTDEYGMIVSNDGTFADACNRMGVSLNVVVETTGKTPLEDAIRVNMVWLEGVMDMVEFSTDLF